MIHWLPKKFVDYGVVESLLSNSHETGMFTNYGPCVRRLETFFREYLEISSDKSVIATASGTAAFDAIITAFGAKSEKSKIKIKTQSFTFPTSAQSKYPNATEIVDIDSQGALNPEKISNEDVTVVTSIFGCVPDLSRHADVSKQAGSFLLLDNAASPLSYLEGKNICNLGNASIVSLHHTKPVGFGEGGLAIVDAEYEDEVRRAINFGFKSSNSKIREWGRNASNWRMSDVSASFIIQHAQRYRKAQKRISDMQKFFVNNLSSGVSMYPSLHSNETLLSCLPVLFGSPVDTSYFLSNGIDAKKYYSPLEVEDCPLSLDFFERIICFPSHQDMHKKDYEHILRTIENYLRDKDKV